MLLKTSCSFMVVNKQLGYMIVIGPSVPPFKKVSPAGTMGFDPPLVVQSTLVTVNSLLAMDPSMIL